MLFYYLDYALSEQESLKVISLMVKKIFNRADYRGVIA